MTLAEPGRPALWWEKVEGGKVLCDLCPRHCLIPEGGRGFCQGRTNRNGAMVLDRWGLISGLSLDPIEKKPLFHFLPGSSVLSFGTVGCNLECAFCQNHELSRAVTTAHLTKKAEPREIAAEALSCGARSVAFTYNEPVTFAEYAIETAHACAESGVKAVAVTAGYCEPEPAEAFFSAMDAANVDLKGFTDSFYREVCGGRLKPVLDTLLAIRHRTSCHLEITNLIVPGRNDSEAEIRAMSEWITKELGADVPLHFSAFHPAWKLDRLPPTPPETLTRARQIAIGAGMRFVYTGNMRDREGSTTFCPGCGATLIERDWFEVLCDRLSANSGLCPSCGVAIPGLF